MVMYCQAPKHGSKTKSEKMRTSVMERGKAGTNRQPALVEAKEGMLLSNDAARRVSMDSLKSGKECSTWPKAFRDLPAKTCAAPSTAMLDARVSLNMEAKG